MKLYGINQARTDIEDGHDPLEVSIRKWKGLVRALEEIPSSALKEEELWRPYDNAAHKCGLCLRRGAPKDDPCLECPLSLVNLACMEAYSPYDKAIRALRVLRRSSCQESLNEAIEACKEMQAVLEKLRDRLPKEE